MKNKQHTSKNVFIFIFYYFLLKSLLYVSQKPKVTKYVKYSLTNTKL